ncbi:MAG: hypothetical protein ACI4GX_09860 [Ruminococcus sp.]
MTTYYEFCLEDYSAPSCTSGSKKYYGTKDDVKKLMDNIQEEANVREYKVFKEFCDGNSQVMNIAGFNEVRFAKRVKLISEKKIDLDERETYTYTNPYGFKYIISMRFTVNRVLLLKSGDKYVIAYYALIRDPKYKSKSPKDDWSTIDMFWGFPSMIKSTGHKDDYYLENMLYMPEKVFDNITDAEQYFMGMQKVDYQMFFEDVFGDG